MKNIFKLFEREFAEKILISYYQDTKPFGKLFIKLNMKIVYINLYI